jgi:hypothetical protein
MARRDRRSGSEENDPHRICLCKLVNNWALQRRVYQKITPIPSMSEQPMLSVNEVAALTAWSRRKVIRMFERERGVIILDNPETLHKRRYRTIRIPRAVLNRVLARYTMDRESALEG